MKIEANQDNHFIYLKIQDYANNNSLLLYAAVFFLVYKPSCFEDIALIDTIWNLAKFGISTLFLVLYCIDSKTVIKYPLIIFIVVLFSTIIHHGIISKVISHWIPGLGMICWLGVNQNNLREIAKVFCVCGGMLIILNTITMVVFPNGMWIRAEASAPIWLLGQKQDFLTCFLPTTFFMIIIGKTDNFMRRYFGFVIICMIISAIITKPVGLIMCMLSLLCLIQIEKKLGIKTNTKLLFSSFVILEIIAILVAYIYSKLTILQIALSTIETGELDKSQTMGTRFSMWAYAWESFLKNPVLGMGQVSENVWYKTSGLDFYHTIIHNFPLDILFTGGGLAFIVYFIWHLSMVKKLSKYSNLKLCRYISYAFFSLCFISLTECPYHPMIFAIYGFIMCIPYVFVRGELELIG